MTTAQITYTQFKARDIQAGDLMQSDLGPARVDRTDRDPQAHYLLVERHDTGEILRVGPYRPNHTVPAFRPGA